MASANVSLKEAHEQFVTGHTGSSVTEIALLTTLAPVSVIIRSFVIAQRHHPCMQFSFDFLLFITPLILCFTVLADMSSTVLTSLIAVATTLCLLLFYSASLPQTQVSVSCRDRKLSGRRPFLTNYRAYVNAASAICILAVDFQIFPRRFCKTETYGTGLMDAGVASYVFSNAIVAREVRGSCPKTSALMRIIKSITSTMPLWILGLCRLISVKAANYQEHLTEYGVHWNFFFTLAVIRVLSTVIYCIIDVQYSWLMSLTIITLYQFSLSSCGLADYILDENTGRVGFVAANREGIFTTFGYLALYCAGVQIGLLLFKPRYTVRDWARFMGLLSVVDVVFWAFYAFAQLSFENASRRLTNLSYVLWMIAHNIQSLTSFLIADLIEACALMPSVSEDPKQPKKFKDDENERKSSTSTMEHLSHDLHLKSLPSNRNLLEAINYNGLLYFLLANLLTGAVNMATVTMRASTLTAMTLLTVYMLLLSSVVSILHSYNISVKFW